MYLRIIPRFCRIRIWVIEYRYIRINRDRITDRQDMIDLISNKDIDRLSHLEIIAGHRDQWEDCITVSNIYSYNSIEYVDKKKTNAFKYKNCFLKALVSFYKFIVIKANILGTSKIKCFNLTLLFEAFYIVF